MKLKGTFFLFLAKVKSWIFSFYWKSKKKDGYRELKIGKGVIIGPIEFTQLCSAAIQAIEKADCNLYSYLSSNVGFLFYPRDDKIGFFTNITYGVWPIRLDPALSRSQNLASALESIFIYAHLRESCINVFGFPTEIFAVSQNEVHKVAKTKAKSILDEYHF